MTEIHLGDLRAKFREDSRVRLSEMASLLDALGCNPHDAESLRELAKHFHGLAGMGGTYGFPRVSEIGDEAEGELLLVMRSGVSPDAPAIARWQQLLSELQRELGTPGAPGTAGGPPAVPPAAGRRVFTALLVPFDPAVAEALSREDVTCVPEDAPADITIVIGEGAFEEKVRAIRSGADVVVTVPVDIEALVRRVVALRERKARPPRRILAVEDDPTTGVLIRGFLGAAGYEVAICREAGEFEKTLLAFEPDLVLMDVQLTNDVSGHDLVRYVRRSERFATLPVIIVTSDSQRRAILDSAQAGADLLVSKPVDWDVLLSQIAACLERASAVRERTERDGLTGLLTRAAFDARARQRAESGNTAVLAILDLDHFKQINDTHGHAAGDRVLASTGALLRRGVRPKDVVARYGGEEFALLLEDLSVPDAAALCERLLADMSATVEATFSAGIAPLGASFDEAFRRADAALYEAKRNGRARVIS